MQLNTNIDDQLMQAAHQLRPSQTDQEILEIALRAWLQIQQSAKSKIKDSITNNDLDSINRHATRLNQETQDALEYQISL